MQSHRSTPDADAIPGPAVETEQPSFRRFHVPCRYPASASARGALPLPGAAAVPHMELAYVTALLALMPASSGFTNVLDANAQSGTFGEAVRWVGGLSDRDRHKRRALSWTSTCLSLICYTRATC